jgi:hypothetical protein
LLRRPLEVADTMLWVSSDQPQKKVFLIVSDQTVPGLEKTRHNRTFSGRKGV